MHARREVHEAVPCADRVSPFGDSGTNRQKRPGNGCRVTGGQEPGGAVWPGPPNGPERAGSGAWRGPSRAGSGGPGRAGRGCPLRVANGRLPGVPAELGTSWGAGPGGRVAGVRRARSGWVRWMIANVQPQHARPAEPDRLMDRAPVLVQQPPVRLLLRASALRGRQIANLPPHPAKPDPTEPASCRADPRGA